MLSLPCLATVKYDYTGLEDSELTVKKGDRVNVEQVDVSGWCLATLTDYSRSGSVPFSYLELYTHSSPSPAISSARRTSPSPLPSRATPPPPKIQTDSGTRRKRTPVAWSDPASRPHSVASVASEDDLPPPPSNPPDEEFALPHGDEDIPPPPREPAPALTPLPPDDTVFPPPPPGEDDGDSSDLPVSSDSDNDNDGQKKPRQRKKMQDVLKQERADAAKEYFEKFQEPSEDVGLNDKGEFDSRKWAAEMLNHDAVPSKEEDDEPGGLPTRASLSGRKALRPSRREKKIKPKTSMTLSPPDLMQLDLSSVTGDTYNPELMTPMVMTSVSLGGGHNPFRRGLAREPPPQLSAKSEPPPTTTTPAAEDTPSSTTQNKTYRFNNTSKNSSRTNSLPSNNGNEDLSPEKKTWKYSLFGCSGDWGFCCTATFCPCVAIGKNYALRHGRESKNNTYENKPCCLTGILCCFGGCVYYLPCYTIKEHREIAKTLGIASDNKEPSSFMLGCCYPCTLTLDYQELIDWNFNNRPKPQVMDDSEPVYGYENRSPNNKKGSKNKKLISSPSGGGETAVHWHGGAQKNGS